MRGRRFKTQSDIDRYVARGYGQGSGPDYKPWLRVQHVASRGRPRQGSGLRLKTDISWMAGMGFSRCSERYRF
ncbi:hypothetical protein B0G69_1352 [Paraburkholderia sp. RAU2J]|nr:hypothetical protein B0G69_1352 [Paraburkholderia sp. RAU2J]